MFDGSMRDPTDRHRMGRRKGGTRSRNLVEPAPRRDRGPKKASSSDTRAADGASVQGGERGFRVARWLLAVIPFLDPGKGLVAVLAVAGLFLVLLLIGLWILLPFAAFAMEKRLLNLLREAQRSNELLEYMTQLLEPAREESEAETADDEAQVEESGAPRYERSDES